jgi:hypothetical protein
LTLLQLFERQVTEDGDLSTKVWAKDRSPLREGQEDPDTDDYLPIPRARPVRKGKQLITHSISDKEDEDCCILAPINAIPISWLPPCVPAKDDEGTSRKRAEASESDAPQAKRRKKAGSKPNRLKPMPTTKG